MFGRPKLKTTKRRRQSAISYYSVTDGNPADAVAAAAAACSAEL